MSQFEFTTREQREAWRVIRPLLVPMHNHTFGSGVYPDFDQAAARFDQREATCGIEPLSVQHAALIVWSSTSDEWMSIIEDDTMNDLHEVVGLQGERILNDKGRTVLAKLNAMCKVQS